jgi:hypothetical protein
MTNDELLHLEGLVRTYVSAHQNRITLAERTQRRMLWVSPPVKAEYDAVLHVVRAAAIRPRHSDALVEDYVDDLLQSALDDPGGIVAEVRGLGEALEYPVTTRRYIPLDGIAVEEPELRLGSVRLVRMDDEAFERLYDAGIRERVVLRRLLVDAFRDRNVLLQLRPLAHELEAALRDTYERGGELVPVALTALASLPWVAETLRTRLASDFT